MSTELPASGFNPGRFRSFAIVGVGLLALAGVWAWSGMESEAVAQMPLKPEKIDGARAFKYLEDICKIGPRPAGSPANTRQRQMVAMHFTKMGGKVREQVFKSTDPRTSQPVSMANLVGSWFPDRKERVVIGAHYDTRPFPDEDKDPAKRKIPFIGANDGASGVALLMEIAHHLSESPTPWGVDLVLFDGEELVYGGGQDQDGEYFLGSKEFGRLYAESIRGRRDDPNATRYIAGIVLDMVGDKDLQIDKEPYSLEFNQPLVREIWAVARSLKVMKFRDRTGQAVYDDHLPLYNSGIPAIDIIDFKYPHWHTAEDTPDKCSAESLESVGKVVTAWLNKPKPRGTRR